MICNIFAVQLTSMTDFYNILIFATIILIIEFYSEIHLGNYGNILQRLYHLFGVKTVFNIFKISVLFSISYVAFDLYKVFGFLNWRFVESKILNLEISGLYQYFIVPLGISILIIFFNSDQLFKKFRVFTTSNRQVDGFITNILYITFRLISFVLTFGIFKTILGYAMKLDFYFNNNNLALLDWLIVNKNGQDNYNKGVYFSLVITVLAFILFNNAFIKRNSDSWDYRKIKLVFFKYFFITIILCIGLFFGFFSIFNGIFNVLNSSFSEWFSKENVLGILPIRTSSILIITYLSIYIYKHVLYGRVLEFLVLGIFPIRNINKYEHYDRFIVFENRETLFFAQISFYILNIALAELYIIFGYNGTYLSLLNFSILFILDDFKIISDYSNDLRSVLKSHFYRIWIFNLIMFVTSLVLLINKAHHVLLGGYLLLTVVLLIYYLRNASSIKFTNGLH